jgi:hypothetical protein
MLLVLLLFAVIVVLRSFPTQRCNVKPFQGSQHGFFCNFRLQLREDLISKLSMAVNFPNPEFFDRFISHDRKVIDGKAQCTVFLTLHDNDLHATGTQAIRTVKPLH